LTRDQEEWRAVCDKGLPAFEQQHIDAAEAKRMRRHQQRNSPPQQQRGRDPLVQYVAVFAPQPSD